MKKNIKYFAKNLNIVFKIVKKNFVIVYVAKLVSIAKQHATLFARFKTILIFLELRILHQNKM